MKNRLTQFRLYLILLTVASYLLLGQSFDLAAMSVWVRPAILFLLALAVAGTRIRLQPINAALATPDLFVFGTVISVPSGPLAVLAAVVAALLSHYEGKRRQRQWEMTLRLLVAALGAILARLVYFELNADYSEELLSLAGAAATFLILSGFTESLKGRLSYWRRVALPRSVSAIEIGLLFTPAALLFALAFNPAADPLTRTFLWHIAPAVISLYVLGEWRLGPLYEDPRKKNEMDQVYLRAVEALALAVEAKDSVSGTHLKRVQYYCVEIAKALNCTATEIRALEFGALLHDIGKIAVPEDLLTKPSRLSAHEFSQVASHARIGAEILSAVNFPFPVAELVLSHHENWDGTGYPRKLKGEEIPLTARILTVVDNFDALTSDRPYRAALTVKQAVDFIESRKGKAFEPVIADVLIELLPRLEEELQQDPAFRRGMMSSSSAIKSPRAINVEQTALTYQEKLESLKQNRTAARDLTPAVEHTATERLLSSLAVSLSRKEIVRFLLPRMAAKIPFDECAVFMSGGSELRAVFCSGPKADLLRNLRIPINESPTGWVAGYGRSLINGNPTGEHSDLGMMASLQGLKSALVVPLWDAGKVIGTFNLYSKTTGDYSDEHAAVLESMTRGLGKILLEAGCYENSVRGAADTLTSLPNARRTLVFLEAAIAEARQDKRDLAVLAVDVDHFRPINSRKGYPAGDQLLLLITQILKAPQQNFEFVARLGDDRFVAVLADVPATELESLAQQLKQTIRAKCDLPSLGFDEPISVSVGAASLSAGAETPEELRLQSYQRAYLEKISRAGITIQLAEGGRIGSASRIAAV